MPDVTQKTAELKQAAMSTFTRLNTEFLPTTTDEAMLRLMGVKPCNEAIQRLNSGDSYRRGWKEKSSTWDTKK